MGAVETALVAGFGSLVFYKNCAQGKKKYSSSTSGSLSGLNHSVRKSLGRE